MCDLFTCFLFKQKTAYEMRISDLRSDVCSSDLGRPQLRHSTPVRPELVEGLFFFGTIERKGRPRLGSGVSPNGLEGSLDMKTLVWVEHDGSSVKDATLAAVTAASKLGEVHLLVAGEGVDGVDKAASEIAGVGKVHVADNAAFAPNLPETIPPPELGKATGRE